MNQRNLVRVSNTRKSAVSEARAINSDLRSRGIKRKGVVRRMTLRSIKPLLRSESYKDYKKRKKNNFYGIFMRSKK